MEIETLGKTKSLCIMEINKIQTVVKQWRSCNCSRSINITLIWKTLFRDNFSPPSFRQQKRESINRDFRFIGTKTTDSRLPCPLFDTNHVYPFNYRILSRRTVSVRFRRINLQLGRKKISSVFTIKKK